MFNSCLSNPLVSDHHLETEAADWCYHSSVWLYNRATMPIELWHALKMQMNASRTITQVNCRDALHQWLLENSLLRVRFAGTKSIPHVYEWKCSRRTPMSHSSSMVGLLNRKVVGRRWFPSDINALKKKWDGIFNMQLYERHLNSGGECKIPQ